LVHHTSQQAALKSAGVEDVLCGDMRRRSFLAQAAKGVEAIYHICPNMSPDEVKIGRLMLEAARSNGIQHFVYHSVLHPQAQQMPHHWNKLKVETEILASGLAFTILQPTAYMQNILGVWAKILSEGVYSIPYSAGARISLVDLEDVAEVAAKVLMDPGYQNGIFELVGTPAYSQAEIAGLISQKMGKTVQIEEVSRTAWEKQARKSGMSEYAIQTLLKMFLYYETYGMGGNSSGLTGILGRRPTSYDQFLDKLLAHSISE
jgi:uncharacterized protein YbjT (DUF2867 family)